MAAGNGASRSIGFVLEQSDYWASTDLTSALMLGGREIAALRIGEELAKLGWDVAIFCHIAATQLRDGLTYRPLNEARTALVRCLVAVGDGDYGVLRGARAPERIAWVQTGLPTLRSLDAHIHAYVVNSPHKAAILQEANPQIAPAKVAIIPNGVRVADVDACPAKTIHGRLLWSQSPDRGLYHLLRWWPTLKAKLPYLTLHVTYDHATVAEYRWGHLMAGEWARAIEEGKTLPGVTYTGAVSRKQLTVEQKETELWCYPCDPDNQPIETFNMSAMEMAAARVPMLLSNDVQLAEPYGAVAWFKPLPIDDADWIDGIVTLLTDKQRRLTHVAAARALAEAHDWAKIAASWVAVLDALAPRPFVLGAR